MKRAEMTCHGEGPAWTVSDHLVDLASYASGALSEAEAEAIDLHLLGCDQCQRRLTELQQVREVLGHFPPEILIDGPAEDDRVLRGALERIRNGRWLRCSGADSATGVRVDATFTTVGGAVRVRVRARGLPAATRCQLVVIPQHGPDWICLTWCTPPAAEGDVVTVDGTTSVALDGIAALEIRAASGVLARAYR